MQRRKTPALYTRNLQIRIRFGSRTPAQATAFKDTPASETRPLLENLSPGELDVAASTPGGSAAFRVALGILISRLTGLIRERVIAHYFGNSAVADAFRAAIRIPNLLNNLFGEGVLSTSFVTVYSKLRAQGRNEAADHLARAVFGLLAVVCSILVCLVILLTPILIDVIAPGFRGQSVN